MPNELTFRASRTKAVILVLFSIVIVPILYFIRAESPLISWIGMIFFGLGGVVILIAAFRPNSIYLRLDSEGFEMGSLFKKKTRIKWIDVQRFELGSVKGAKMIAIVYAPHYKERKIERALAAKFSGMEGGISDSYNVPLTQILETLSEWRARHGSG